MLIDYRPKIQRRVICQVATIVQKFNRRLYAKLLTQLRKDINTKCPRKLMKGVFHQTNTPTHKSLLLRAAVCENGFGLVDQPTYSLDLAQFDYHLLSNRKKINT